MSASIGREFLIKRGSVVIAGVRSKSVSINGEAVDITSDDDGGYRTLLSTVGTKSMDLSVEGVSKDADLRDAMLSGSTLLLTDVNLEYPNGDTVSGNFFLTSFEESAPYNEATTFTASLQSSGEFTYVAV